MTLVCRLNGLAEPFIHDNENLDSQNKKISSVVVALWDVRSPSEQVPVLSVLIMVSFEVCLSFWSSLIFEKQLINWF